MHSVQERRKALLGYDTRLCGSGGDERKRELRRLSFALCSIYL